MSASIWNQTLPVNSDSFAFRKPDEWTLIFMLISEINIYPIKSLKGISLDSAVVEARGLQNDRRWMLVDENNQFLSQREIPAMALVKIGIDAEKLTASFGEFRQWKGTT